MTRNQLLRTSFCWDGLEVAKLWMSNTDDRPRSVQAHCSKQQKRSESSTICPAQIIAPV